MSRIGRPIWSEKPILLLATSPGPRGGQTVLSTAVNSFPHQGAKVAGSFSLPSFNKNFDSEKGIIEQDLKAKFQVELEQFTTLVGNSVVV